ncbi:MAG TPA: hypothetical protein VE860_22925 [Chthoniobacterales bacterium]|nr:hypothetical protein [Chthoniobacterales bacterium]
MQLYLHDRDVGRPCPSSAELAIALTAEVDRTQRRSDGTVQQYATTGLPPAYLPKH